MLSRTDAHAVYAQVRTDADMRLLALNDLFFLMVVVMGREDMDNEWCFARCREVAAKPDGYLDLWAREHYKSTIITVGKTIQDILNNPEITVGIFSHTRPVAKSFLMQIKRTFETCALLQALFPDIVWKNPRREAPKWSENEGIIVKRATNPKEATIEAWGLVDGQPTGKHFSLMIFDDVVTRESVTTPEQIAKTTEAWQLALNLGASGGTRRIIGTRYHAADTYDAIIRQGSAIPRVHPATKDGSMDGEPVFMDADTLARKRRDMGSYVFACQMLQNPRADSVAGFRAEWFRTYHGELSPTVWERMHRYLLVDPASEKKRGSDYTVMWVIGLGEDKNYYILDGVRDRLSLTERAGHLFRLHRQYHPRMVGYEKYGQQADIEHMQSRMAQEGYHFHIIPLGGAMPKNDRIRRLVPLFEAGRVLFPIRLVRNDFEGRARDLTHDFMHDEMLMFPVARHDDMLDCLARIVDPGLGAVFPRGEYGGGSREGRVHKPYNPATFGLAEPW